MRKLAVIFALAALASGCASAPMAVSLPCSPPVVYLQEVEEPQLRGGTNKELAEWALALREALRRANLDKRRLREWASE